MHIFTIFQIRANRAIDDARIYQNISSNEPGSTSIAGFRSVSVAMWTLCIGFVPKSK